ncbi:MAG TPA: hypothetical protein VGF20_01855 [Candidatus Acidoferrum sp.]|jgi:hypothetical protein
MVDEGAWRFQNENLGGLRSQRADFAMSNEGNAVEQAVVRALRDTLERLQRNSDELHHSVADVVAACSSTKPTNALSPLLRAQTSAASLNAALEVLSRFVAVSLQPAVRSPLEAEISRLATNAAQSQAPVEVPEALPEPISGTSRLRQAVEAHSIPVQEALPEPVPVVHEAAPEPIAQAETSSEFEVNRLSPEEQELHRRANRVAKVSMQDIKMLHPDKVRQGRENKDLCVRLKDDIEKAHREYDRRFKPIMDHPVDYFYRWMVEILAEGDASALGEYPYAVPVRQH